MGKTSLLRNNVNRYGHGSQPILFAHGYGCDQNMWRFVAPSFHDDYQIILFDHTGSGKSDVSQYDFEKYASLKGYADDIIEICEDLELKDVILVTHSVSTMIGVLASVKRPDLFAKLILIGPSPRYINDAEYFGGFDQKDIDELMDTLDSNYLGWSSAITPVIVGNPDKPEVAKELHNSFCSMHPEIAKHFAKVTFLSDNRKDLPNVSVPCLVIQCTPDYIASTEVGKFVDRKLPNSTFVQINTPGHCPHLTAPDLTIETIKTFIESTT